MTISYDERTWGFECLREWCALGRASRVRGCIVLAPSRIFEHADMSQNQRPAHAIPLKANVLSSTTGTRCSMRKHTSVQTYVGISNNESKSGS